MVDSNRFATSPNDQTDEQTANESTESNTTSTTQPDSDSTKSDSSTTDSSSSDRVRLGTIRIPEELRGDIEEVKKTLNEESIGDVSKNATVTHLLKQGVMRFQENRE